MMDADGDNEERLTDSGVDEYPEWSPDGEKIAFRWIATAIDMNSIST